MIRLVCLVLGYIFGAFQTAYFYGKMHGIDIRTVGSGNAGTTNILRTYGKKMAALTFACDFLKAAISVLLPQPQKIPWRLPVLSTTPAR